mgnify:CR=1 FL=1
MFASLWFFKTIFPSSNGFVALESVNRSKLVILHSIISEWKIGLKYLFSITDVPSFLLKVNDMSVSLIVYFSAPQPIVAIKNILYY